MAGILPFGSASQPGKESEPVNPFTVIDGIVVALSCQTLNQKP
jgi:hypothetical protein